MSDQHTYTAFAGEELIVSGPLDEMLRRTKAHLDRADGGDAGVLIFDDETGRQVDFDFRGTTDEVVARATPLPLRAGPGRPRLGVVSREVSLLPRHWAWLEEQPNGASATLRRLVEEARRHESGRESTRRSVDAAGGFMTAMAGDRPGFEEAYRALYAGDRERFESLVARWPRDVRAHILRLAADAFRPEGAARDDE